MARNDNRPMSIDAMLDMERKEVLALLENKAQASSSPERVRSSSPYTPRSPVRSMLDIAEEEGGSSAAPSRPAPPRAPVRSMLDIDSPPPSPRPGSAQVVRSMLDTTAPVPPPSRQPLPQIRGSSTTPNSPATPTDPSFRAQGSSHVPHGRSMSDAAHKPVEFGPRAAGGLHDRTAQYQFSDIYSNTSGGQQLPKRNTQAKWQSGSSMGQALRNSDLGGLQLPPLPNERGRHSSLSGRLGGNKSKSPQNRLANRSRSPATFSLLGPNKAMLDDGQVVDISSAYRRLSDANLAFSGGSLSQLPRRKRSDEAGEGRLVKDYLGPDGEHLGSSDEDDEPYSSDDEDRGRKKDPRALNPGARGESGGSGSRSRSNRGQRKTLSLLAAAEEERTQVASQQPQYKYKSLLPEPEIKVTTSAGDTIRPAKNAVHPNTSYNEGIGSATPSLIDSDDEADVDDIKRAQKLSFSMTNILTAPESHRAIRIIDRGEYSKIVQAAEDEHHRLRKYLVATDLSDESAHAMEWAIGTVLRDGDTLIAIYCVDEETGIVTEEGALVPDETKAMKEQAAAINSVANSKATPAPTSLVTDFKRQSALHFRTDSASTPGSSPAPAARGSRAEEERRRAVEQVTDRVLRLLRKTRLQVRVVVEVLHCKNPKHLITEVIDLVNPTLVVIGSRGRSALKGVILGSFSNYLVTKSSVPVMVARKRLRKQSQYKKAGARQVNNLANPSRSLANAKVD